MIKNPIFCAIDTTDPDHARRLIAAIAPHVGGIKLGLEFFTRHGVEGVKRVMQEGVPLFLDLKFHDIPNTVAGAIRALAGLNIFMTTIHASGGVAMMQAAKEAASMLPSNPKVLGVTVLTSLEQQDLMDAGINNLALSNYAIALGKNAVRSGIDGIVCSGHELHDMRSQVGNHLLYVVPGIRPAGSGEGDQKRVMTPKDALASGANYLVIGRPITGADNPAKAAQDIAKSLIPA